MSVAAPGRGVTIAYGLREAGLCQGFRGILSWNRKSFASDLTPWESTRGNNMLGSEAFGCLGWAPSALGWIASPAHLLPFLEASKTTNSCHFNVLGHRAGLDTAPFGTEMPNSVPLCPGVDRRSKKHGKDGRVYGIEGRQAEDQTEAVPLP